MSAQSLDGLARLGNGQRIDHLVRSLWDQAATEGQEFGEPADRQAAAAFTAWLRGPGPRGARRGVNRYLYAAYLTRPDLKQRFPDLDGRDGTRLIRWARHEGSRELLGELVPGGEPLSVNVIGFLGEALGLGEAARLYVSSLQAASVDVSTTVLRPDAGMTRDGSHRPEVLRGAIAPAFNLACVNADFLAAAVAQQGAGLLGERPTIGQWGWETDVLPPSWAGAFELVEEVWVYSSFVAQNLGRLLPVPVVVVPPPVAVPEMLPADRQASHAGDRFTFLNMVDLFSTPQRKNPAGVIDAFIRAFAPGDGPRLVMKTLNGRHRPAALEALKQRAGERADIEFIDGYLPAAQKAALLERADCFVSLHRSEGFGLGLAESMARGTPVIATGYSGNMDFMSSANGWLVDWRETEVGPDCEVYPAHGHWAEPDLDHAAALMRTVYEDRAAAAAKASRAREDISGRYAPEVVGEIARARLELLLDTARPGRAVERNALETARRRLGSAARRVRAKLTGPA